MCRARHLLGAFTQFDDRRRQNSVDTPDDRESQDSTPDDSNREDYDRPKPCHFTAIPRNSNHPLKDRQCH